MKSKKAYTVEELRRFRELRSEHAELRQEREKVAAEIARLEAERDSLDATIEEVESVLSAEFSELREAEDLFGSSTCEVADESLEDLAVADTGYVKSDTKKKLLRKIMSDFAAANPKAEAISYRDVKNTLEREYGIECRSIANFFVGMLDGYETTGGNRNKAIVLPKP